jgi:uncharacterized coiled-coil protein SlyX
MTDKTLDHRLDRIEQELCENEGSIDGLLENHAAVIARLDRIEQELVDLMQALLSVTNRVIGRRSPAGTGFGLWHTSRVLAN